MSYLGSIKEIAREGGITLWTLFNVTRNTLDEFLFVSIEELAEAHGGVMVVVVDEEDANKTITNPPPPFLFLFIERVAEIRCAVGSVYPRRHLD